MLFWLFPQLLTDLYFHQQGIRGPLRQHAHQYLLVFIFFVKVVLIGVRGCLNVTWLCVPLMATITQSLLICASLETVSFY